MEEPQNPEHYFIYKGREEIDGVMGYVEIKKWYVDGKCYEHVLKFEPYEKENKNEQS